MKEAEATVAAGQERADSEIAAAQADVGRLSEQAREASEQIQRLQAALDDTRQRLAATEQTLRDRDTIIAGLHERTAGLERQLTERESHLASIEVKHQQARDALEHFRLASKEQREVEARQHEQAVQALQVELRRATESVAAKNDELLTLNRDNARLTEQTGRKDKVLRDARRDLHTALERAAELDATRQRSESMERRAADAVAKLETARSELADMEARHAAERLAYSDALRDAQAQSERLVSIESMLSALHLPPASAEKNADGVEANKQ
jgi:chromosome segregation ATPase